MAPINTIVATLLLFTASASASVGGRCVDVTDGVCADKSKCTGTYTWYVNDACPYDGNNIKCCLRNFCGPKGDGICKFTSDGCPGGKFVSGLWTITRRELDSNETELIVLLCELGYCPMGGSNYKCCTNQL
ncbi:hypothetical protein HDV00_004282 [Rhizophlyctis rosea]|nr:hypothetical protein HDV00_004282 [Rhizophlyctis rosea]